MADNELLCALLDRCGRGDESALKSLYTATSPKLYSLLLRIVKKRETAEEILQEVFLKVWNRADDYHSGKGSVMTWICTIARNRALDEIRKRNPAEPGPEIDETSWDDESGMFMGPLQDTMRESEARRIEVCLESLENNQKQSIFLAFFHGKTHIEIARFLDIPLGTVKSWVRRGLKQLRDCLDS